FGTRRSRVQIPAPRLSGSSALQELPPRGIFVAVPRVVSGVVSWSPLTGSPSDGSGAALPCGSSRGRPAGRAPSQRLPCSFRDPLYVHQGVAAVQVGVAAVVYVLGNLAAKLR